MKDDLKEKEAGPPDPFYSNVVLWFSLGIVGVTPVHFVILETNFWMYKFRNPVNETWDDKNRNSLQTQFANNGNTVVNVGNIVFTIVAVLIAKKFGAVCRASTGLFGILVSFVIFIVFAVVNTDSWQDQFYIVVLFLLLVQTGFCSVLAVSLFDMSAKFPPNYVAMLSSGQPVCEVLAAVIQIIALGTGASPKSSAMVHFVVGFMIVFYTTVLFLHHSRRNEFFCHYLRREIGEVKISLRFLMTVLNKVKYVLLTFGVVTGTTVMMHPGVTSLVVSVMDSGTKWADIYFTPVATILVYNIAEFIGRVVSLRIQKPSNHIAILSMGILRMVCIPLLLFCNVRPRDYLPVVFDTDWSYDIIIVIFGMSSGYVGNLTVLQIAKSTTDLERLPALYGLIVVLLSSSLAFSAITPALIAAL